jgi:hypothetical protein
MFVGNAAEALRTDTIGTLQRIAEGKVLSFCVSNPSSRVFSHLLIEASGSDTEQALGEHREAAAKIVGCTATDVVIRQVDPGDARWMTSLLETV